MTSTLDTLRFNGEVTVPLELYVPQNLTIGAEWVEDDFSDQENTKQGDGSYGENLTTGDRSKMKSRIASGYLENNMKITDATDMVVGIRFDDHNRSGSIGAQV